VVNNVTVLGHAHPAVRHALNRQLSKLCTNSRFVYSALGDYARAIVDRMPKGSGLDSVFFVNSGSEAVDLALRIARATTGRQDVLCMEGGYHGVTTATDQISTTLNDNPNSRDSRPKFIHLCPMPNLYRGKFRADPNNQTEVDTAVGQYVNAVQDILDKLVRSSWHVFILIRS
jgi:4-aminobutyrate aminotransferase-like enzyme